MTTPIISRGEFQKTCNNRALNLFQVVLLFLETRNYKGTHIVSLIKTEVGGTKKCM